jgi:hypothetical protein
MGWEWSVYEYVKERKERKRRKDKERIGDSRGC